MNYITNIAVYIDNIAVSIYNIAVSINNIVGTGERTGEYEVQGRNTFL